MWYPQYYIFVTKYAIYVITRKSNQTLNYWSHPKPWPKCKCHTPPPLTFSLHHHQVSFLLAVWHRKAQNIFFSPTPWGYSIKYFRFPRKLILLSHLPLPNIKTPASPTLWLWELLVIFQLYFKVIFTQIECPVWTLLWNILKNLHFQCSVFREWYIDSQ